MIDLTGSVLVITRDHAPVTAIAGERVGTDERGKAWDAPMVVISDEATTRAPGGRQAQARLGLQETRFEVRCYGITNVQAKQLALAVSDLWHERGITVGTNGALIRQVWADEIGAPRVDPALRRPFVPVYLDVFAEAAPRA